jgi:hypothetical protein
MSIASSIVNRISPRGRALIMLAAIGAALLVMGLDGLREAVGNRARVEMPCRSYLNARPVASWVRLTECKVDFVDAIYRYKKDRVEAVFVPIRISDDDKTPVRLVIATTDRAVLDAVQSLRGAGRTPGFGGELRALADVARRVAPGGVVEGTVRTGLADLISSARDELKEAELALASDARLIDLGRAPSMGRAAAFTAGGLLCVVLIPVVWTKLRRAPEPAGTETAHPAPEAAPAPGAAPAPAPTPEWTGLMLVNVPATAGPEAIETAPPLGARADVLRRLADCLPGLDTQQDPAVFARVGYTLRFRLGADDPVPTIVVETHGAGAIVALRRVTAKTGWRAFAPKKNAFVDLAIV